MRKLKKVPKGWSDYQAAWIPDDDAEFQQDDESDGQNSDDEFMDARSEENSFYSDAEGEDRDFDTVTESGKITTQFKVFLAKKVVLLTVIFNDNAFMQNYFKLCISVKIF